MACFLEQTQTKRERLKKKTVEKPKNSEKIGSKKIGPKPRKRARVKSWTARSSRKSRPKKRGRKGARNSFRMRLSGK